MLEVTVIDRTAESRIKLIRQYEDWLKTSTDTLPILPRIQLRPLAIEEASFSQPPDVVILGTALLEESIQAITSMKTIWPETPLLACVSESTSSMAHLDQIARLGADDVLEATFSSSEFLRKILFLCRRISHKESNGRLILVDSGKGGVGVTSVCGAFAEALYDQGKRVAVIDLDVESQDLSRFLNARPFFNENLQSLLDGAQPLSRESVEQCLSVIWRGEERLKCMAPPAPSEEQVQGVYLRSRTFTSIIETLDESFEIVLVDCAGLPFECLKWLYRLADQILFLVNNDPATFFASVEKIRRAHGQLAPGASFSILSNAHAKEGLSQCFFQRELLGCVREQQVYWCEQFIPTCRAARKWPGSGMTLFSLGSRALKHAVTSLCIDFQWVERKRSRSFLSESLSFVSAKSWSGLWKTKPKILLPPGEHSFAQTGVRQISLPPPRGLSVEQGSSSDSEVTELSDDYSREVLRRFVSGPSFVST